MEQIRVPEAAPEWPSVELGIGEKRSFRKGSTSAFKYLAQFISCLCSVEVRFSKMRQTIFRPLANRL